MYLNVLRLLSSFLKLHSNLMEFFVNYCRYVGKDYSSAQEQMEDDMKAYYSQNSTVSLAQSLSVGQLVAVHAEEDAWLRARIISLEDNRIKASNYFFRHLEKDVKQSCFSDTQSIPKCTALAFSPFFP